ncbi:MAG: VWA domain-containing protein [Deltaproteobacteria bacterium]|nr:VWA domain-containing protein [Deltaproteobacteria bacterium]
MQQVEIKKHVGLVNDSMQARAYLNVIGSSGSPIQGLTHEMFKVYENGSTESQKIIKVETLEAAQTGASIVIVVQASGAWGGIQEEVKKSVAAFINGLGEKDQVAVVDYAEAAETISPFSADKGDVAGKAAKINANGKSYLLYDGLAQATGLYASAAAPGHGSAATASSLPVAKAIIVISDGRDNGSATDVEKVISDAVKRKIPIHAVGHTEMDGEGLKNLEEIARRTGGSYKLATGVDDISKGLTSIKDYINKMYVVEWKTDLDHDGKQHKVDIAMENEGGGASLKGSVTVTTPDFFNWKKAVLITAIILLLLIIAAAIYVLTRPKPLPPRYCPVCKREQMPEWEICLFCLKAAKARMSVQKGAQKGKVYPLVGKIVSIGSGPETNIRLMDGAISGKHAGVAIDGDKFEIVDLGSKNGVLVNGKKTPRRFLRNGDIVTLGMTELKFESTVQAPDDEADD